jgi:antimicrobial peptide system SdpA family protein
MPKLVMATLALGVIWVLMGIYVVHASQVTNPVKLPYGKLIEPPLRMLLPQGWGFFTKSPRDEDFYIYRRTPLLDESWQPVFKGPSSEPHNAFGFNRMPRTQGIEYGVLLGLIPSDVWKTCKSRLLDCLNIGNTPRFKVINPNPIPVLCGSLALVNQKPVPWAWARSATTMPSSYVLLEVSCR